MPIKSIKLKLDTLQHAENEALRKSLWVTHKLFNQGVEHYLKFLVLLRQKDIAPPINKSAHEFKSELITFVRKQQEINQWKGELGDDEQILGLLRSLYELIVPSSVGGTGDAQSLSRKYLSPLVDPNSEGGLGTAKSGRKPSWKIKQENGDPSWEDDYNAWTARKLEDPTTYVLNSLAELGLKPLFQLYTNTVDVAWRTSTGFVRTWDRDMFQQAIERLLSWESWNRKVAEDYEKLSSRYSKLLEEVDTGSNWYEAARNLEAILKRELEQNAFTPNQDFYITARQLRGWRDVYEKWEKLSESSWEEYYWKAVAEVQTRLRGKFGSAHLFQMLSKPEHHSIWRGNPEKILKLAALNMVSIRMRDSKHQAKLTFPHPVKHPLWVRFDARDGNIHKYEIDGSDSKRLVITFDSLIWPTDDGNLEEKQKVQVMAKRNKQWTRQVEWEGNADKKQRFIFRDQSSRFPIQGELRGAKLQFDRSHLEKKENVLAGGGIGPVYLNVSFGLESYLPIQNGRLSTPIGKALKYTSQPNSFLKVRSFDESKLKECIESDLGSLKTIKGPESLKAGLRVMSIDLGQRTMAAVSVFEVQKDAPVSKVGKPDKLHFPIGDTGLFAVHQRSLVLTLPGETEDKGIKEARNTVYAEFRYVRFQVRMLARILWLNTKEEAFERLDELEEMIQAITEYDSMDTEVRNHWINNLKDLRRYADYDSEQWKSHLIEVHRSIERVIGVIIKNWNDKRSDKRKEVVGMAGLSLWNIEDLERSRKLLYSWKNHARFPGQVKRLAEREEFAVRRLQHLQSVKEDRLKQMANLISMTALGYVQVLGEHRWEAKYPACHVILFEDLGRYLFKQDRAPSENSKLMKWAHRSIPTAVAQQGEVFGVQVGDVRAEFSSKFHAKTGAPGIRCTSITQEDFLEQGRWGWRIQKLIDSKFISVEQAGRIKPGDIVPWTGGELFVTLKHHVSDKSPMNLVHIHADINAAQNLQRRFWSQNSEIFRLSCRRVNVGGEAFYVPKTEHMQKRMGKGGLKESETTDVYKWQTSIKLGKRTISSQEEITDEDLIELEEALEDASEMTGEYKTFFRDPSGFFQSPDRWLPQKEYWSRARAAIESRLSKRFLEGGR